MGAEVTPATKLNSKTLSLTTDPMGKLIWSIAVPASMGLFFNTMFNVVDTLCAGWLSTDALAALALSFSLFFLLIAVGSGIAQGTTALIANALGTQDLVVARRIFAQSLSFALVAGILLSAIGLLIAPRIFQLLGAEGAYLATTLAYMNTLLCGGVFFILTMTLNSALSAQGRTDIYRNLLLIGLVANCLLNPLLMWGLFGLPKMGVAGIALATVIVQIGECLLLWRYLKQGGNFTAFQTREFVPDWEILKQIAAQSIPAALNMMTIALGVFVITWFVRHFGKEAVAATGIATRIEQIVLMPVIGLSTAVLSIVGQNHGAGLPERVREAWRTNLLLGVGLMLFGSLLVWIFGKAALGIFTTNPVVIGHGVDYLSVAIVTLPAYPILFVTVFVMQGLKRPTYGLLIGIYRQVVAPILVFQILTFTFDWGLWGVWWGFCFVTWSAAIFALGWGWYVLRPPSSFLIS